MTDNATPPVPGSPEPGSSDTAPHPPVPPPAGSAPQRPNGLGIAALVLGIVAMVFAFIPVANYFGIAVALVGLVLGVIGLLIRGRSKGLPTAGVVLSGVALVLAVVMAVVYAVVFAAAAKAVDDTGSSIVSSSAPSASAGARSSAGANADSGDGKTVDVDYEVTSDAPTATSISYFTIDDGQSGQEQANAATLPWSKQLQLKKNGVLSFSSMSLTAQAAQNATTITCTIKVDGIVKSTQTSTGSFAVVTCSTDGQ